MNSFRKLVAGRSRSGIPRHVIEIICGDGCVQYECFDYEGARQVLTRVVGTSADWIELPTLEITTREYERLARMIRRSKTS